MLFSDIVGHEKVKKTLTRAVSNARIGHAYIFEGASGTGRFTTAMAFAQSLVCENPRDGVACDACKNCLMCKSESHPDIRIITNQLYDPTKKSNDILVDTVRNMKNEIYIKPYMANRKIYIVPKADTMNIHAQNSLLKVFEEPPEYCTIILIAENSEMFLPTIRSRAVTMRFNVLEIEQVSKYLVAKFEDMPESVAHIKACMSGGSIGMALKLAGEKEADELRESTINCIMGLLDKGHTSIYDAALFLKKHKDKILFILNIMRDFFRDLMYLSGTDDEKGIMNFDKYEELKTLRENVSKRGALNLLEIIFKYESYFSKNISYAPLVQCMAMELWEEIHDRGYRS